MVNERYKLMTLAHHIADRHLHNPVFLFVSPPDQGKTDTLDIFLRDVDNVYIIPASSETKGHALIKERGQTVSFCLDEPDDWNLWDLSRVLMSLKHMSTGKLKPARATMYSHGIESEISTSILIFMNDTQFQSYESLLRKCGLYNRALIILSDQSESTINNVCAFYQVHNYRSGSGRLPHFKKEEFILFEPRELNSDEQKWIDKRFQGHRRSTVQWIAKFVNPLQFKEFKPFLNSLYDHRMVQETIEFDTRKKVVLT